MRTTVTISDDVLEAARLIARERGQSLGAVLTDLARSGLDRGPPPRFRNGIELLPVKNPKAVMTLELVNEIRDESP